MIPYSYSYIIIDNQYVQIVKIGQFQHGSDLHYHRGILGYHWLGVVSSTGLIAHTGYRGLQKYFIFSSFTTNDSTKTKTLVKEGTCFLISSKFVVPQKK